MNEEVVTKLLDDVVPKAPSVEGWAGRASGRARRRRVVTGALAAVVTLGVPIGLTISQQGAGPLEATPLPAGSSTAVTTDVPSPPGEVLYTGVVSIWQHDDQESPNICMGTILESYPPKCPGPSVRGDFSWDDVPFSEDAGLRQSGALRVVGTYDVADRSLTLTEPTVPVSPEDLPTASAPEVPDFSQLCTDMLVDADPARADSASFTRLQNLLEELPVVKTWVSDGVDAFNVLVRGDAEATFTELRTVWGGELCVESAEAPTEVELQAVMDRVWGSVPDGTLLGGSGENYPEAVLTFPVVIATPELVATLQEAAGPDFEVVLQPKLVPLEETASPTPTHVLSPTHSRASQPGTQTGTPKGPPPESDPAAPREVRAQGAIVQHPGEDPLLCLDGVSWSWIPGCAAPLPLVGLDWGEVPHSDREGTLVADSVMVRGFLSDDATSFAVTAVEFPGKLPTVLPRALEASTQQQDAATEQIQRVLPKSRLAVENSVSPGYPEELDFVSVRLAEYDPEVVAAIERAAGSDVSVRVVSILTPVDLEPATLINFGDWSDEEGEG